MGAVGQSQAVSLGYRLGTLKMVQYAILPSSAFFISYSTCVTHERAHESRPLPFTLSSDVTPSVNSNQDEVNDST